MLQTLTVLIKPSSSLCNLQCDYCFYHDESSHREMKSHGLMKIETAKAIIDKALNETEKEILFAFQGGEPTLSGLNFFKEFVNYVNSNNNKNVVINFSIQTNGILIDEKWGKFLHDNHFLVGLSFDGDDEKQNQFRHDANMNLTNEILKRTIKILNEYQVEYNILSVITSKNYNKCNEIHRFIKNNNIAYVQFIPCLNPFYVEEDLEFTLKDEQYYSFLTNMFDIWYQDFLKGDYFSVRMFDNLYFMSIGQGAEQCGMTPTCNIQFVIESNGDVYPCDFFCLDDYVLGNILDFSFEDLMNNSKAKQFLNKKKISKECETCEAYKYCFGGCSRYFEKGKYKYCNTMKKFIPSIKERLKKINSILSK